MAIYYRDGHVEYEGLVVATTSSSTQYVMAFDTMHFAVVWDGTDFEYVTTSFYHDGLDEDYGIKEVH